jgi:subtilisin family serine protease
MIRYPFLLLLGLSPVMAAPREIVTKADGGGHRVMQLAEDELVQRVKGGRTRVISKAAHPRSWAGSFAEHPLERKWAASAAEPAPQPVYYEAGLPRTSEYRRILTPQILLSIPEGGDRETLRQTLELLGIPARCPEYSDLLVFATLPDPEAAAAALPSLQTLPGVASAELVWGRALDRNYMPNDPLFSGTGSEPATGGFQWYLNPSDPRHMGVAGWWDTYRGKGIRVNVVDDGIETLHPDLTANTDRTDDKDYWDDDGDPNPAPGDNHGTAVAGIIGGRGNNGKGISGIAPECSLIGVRLDFDSANPIEVGDVLKHKSSAVHVSNNSWGMNNAGLRYSDIGQPGIDAIRDGVENGRGGRGLIYVVAAGNEGGTPAANAGRSNFGGSPFVLTVGALNPDGTAAGFSSPGANVGVSAYGENITTTSDSGGYRDDFNGTSAASPVTSGIVALVLNARPVLSWRDVQDIMMRSALKTGEVTYRMNGGGYSFHDKTGAGLVNGERAIRLARNWDLLSGASTAEASYRTVAVGITDAKLGANQTIIPGVTTRTINMSKNLRANSVLLTMQIEHGNRGDLDIFLTSPSGMTSQMLVHNIADKDTRLSWTFRSVQFWGENCAGDWKVKVVDNNPGPIIGDDRIIEMKLRVLGTSVLPRPAPRGGAVAGRQNTPFWYEASASGNPSRYWANGLPAGLTMDDLGAISGTPASAGTHQVTIFANNASGTGSTVLTLNIEPDLTPYQIWQVEQLAGLPPEARADQADADGDGVPNLVEYLTGGNPQLVGDRDGLCISLEAGQSFLTWYEKPGITAYRLIVEGTANLTDWQPLQDLPETLPGEMGTLFSIPLDPASANRYFRLRAYQF